MPKVFEGKGRICDAWLDGSIRLGYYYDTEPAWAAYQCHIGKDVLPLLRKAKRLGLTSVLVSVKGWHDKQPQPIDAQIAKAKKKKEAALCR